MPYLAQDDKLLDQDKQQAQGGASGESAVIGGGSAPATIGGQEFVSNPGAAGVGKGGFGGWTNIQSYLSDNSGKQSSADNLNRVVGGQFDKEQQDLTSKASETKSKAQGEVESNKIGQDQASKMIQEAGQNYNYNGQQNDAYTQNVQKLNQGVSKQYAGPTSFDYGAQAKTQEYGQNLGQNFQAVMSDVYDNAAGRKLGTGIQNLQRQLDQDNQYVANARQQLLQKYAGLNDTIGSTVQATNQDLSGLQDQYKANQGELKNYLQGQGTSNRNQVQDAVDRENTIKNAFIAANPDEHKITNADYSAFAGDSRTIPIDTFYDRTYVGGDAALSNVAGVDAQRNQYNAIMDALGMSDKIGKDADPYKIGYMHQMATVSDPTGVMSAPALSTYQQGADNSAAPISGEDFRKDYIRRTMPSLYREIYGEDPNASGSIDINSGGGRPIVQR